MSTKVKMHAKNVNNEYVQVHPETTASQVVVESTGKTLEEILTGTPVIKEGLGTTSNPIISSNSVKLNVMLKFVTQDEAGNLIDYGKPKRIDIHIPKSRSITIGFKYDLTSYFGHGNSHGNLSGWFGYQYIDYGGTNEIWNQKHVVLYDGMGLSDSFRVGNIIMTEDDLVLSVYKLNGENDARIDLEFLSFMGESESFAKNITVSEVVTIDPSELPPRKLPIDESAVVERGENENGKYVVYADGRVEIDAVVTVRMDSHFARTLATPIPLQGHIYSAVTLSNYANIVRNEGETDEDFVNREGYINKLWWDNSHHYYVMRADNTQDAYASIVYRGEPIDVEGNAYVKIFGYKA